MTDQLAHRGPDDRGVWLDEQAQAGMGHRRLSILDLSAAGNQPMHSRDGRWVIAYNGEIYNYGSIREELSQVGTSFIGESDTEVALEAVAHWGIRRAIQMFDGIFSIALWDRHERTGWLIRDPVGVKPLYLCQNPGLVLFASELVAFRGLRDWARPVSREALAEFFTRGYVPGPHSIYRDVVKLPPGTITRISLGTTQGSPSLEQEAYFDWSDTIRTGLAARSAASSDVGETRDELRDLLSDTVRAQCVSDAPLGAFLSGGIDSSLVVSLMQSTQGRPIKTFTIGFEDPAFDESSEAGAIAQFLSTDHSSLILTMAEAQSIVPEIAAQTYDEPFADVSQIPTYLISRFARQEVKVALSGDGGDELFCGYSRYVSTPKLWRMARCAPVTVWAWLEGWLTRVPPGTANFMLRWARRHVNASWEKVPAPQRFRTLLRLFRQTDLMDFYAERNRLDLDIGQLLHGDDSSGQILRDQPPWIDGLEYQERMMQEDLRTYLPDNILVKLDRASMAHGLEARVPLLGRRVVEAAWRIPHSMKTSPRGGKQILRNILAEQIPADLFERGKMGFHAPISDWLRSGLRDWMLDNLSQSALDRAPHLQASTVHRLVRDHLGGQTDYGRELWAILAYVNWANRGAAKPLN